MITEQYVEENGRLYKITKEDVTGTINIDVEIAKLQEIIDEATEKMASFSSFLELKN